MTKFFEELFPKDQNWLEGAYKDPREMLTSFECLTSYLLKYCSETVSQKEIMRIGAFLLEEVDVVFIDKKICPRKTLNTRFGSRTLQVNVPDDKSWNNQKREEVREMHLMKYTSVVKESQIRCMTLLWKLIPSEKQKQLIKNLKSKKSRNNKKGR